MISLRTASQHSGSPAAVARNLNCRAALVVLIAHQEDVLSRLDAVQHVQPAAGFTGENFQSGMNARVGQNPLHFGGSGLFLQKVRATAGGAGTTSFHPRAGTRPPDAARNEAISCES